ncbi:flagellar filament capping protein FliD [Enterobacter cancerogenus]|jgi:flagellar hook-associated protein 2|uniref:Flagellar hook-associated protein 2 n=1 Tax=Enterobacter cancerogenus TaxID=69218 RepID=A0AB38P7V6_9ENTR|nr:flagellar filament capping protein FliD [Enterobacter cancerogenus]EFC56352.1 flagellar hook-associated protein 2 [Enterobacter cancerogenus ATCC 35316]MDT7008547.1 flagellar filament capping protein FliD [Enterobacter cancerogenus]TKK20734.1 flagellar filament capping protein FliD [Enterobacter cancerogenus]WNN58415.1 flagellar filament capping protein FliD [Enterobacter cancerogenus]CAD5356566.1 flagellar filament capping protein [Enterobacter cancerogenus]
MATITNLGIGSAGLGDLYNQLDTAERTKLKTITTQQTTYNAQLSAYGKLQSAMTNLQTATAALAKPATWNSTSVSSTNTAFTATTSTEASTGTFTVNVNQMAKAQVLTSGSISSNTEKLGEVTGAKRTITITQPGTKKPLEVELSDADTSLSGIASAINKANGNVTASVIKAKDGDYRLMLTSKSTGTDGQMSINVTGDDTLQAAIGYDSASATGALTVQTKAQNAVLVVNDITIERQSNTISDALPGVTFTVKAESKADETLDITRATDANQKAISDWVTAYNSLQSTINSVTKYVAVEAGEDQSASNGALVGDGNVRGIQAQLRSMLTDVQSGSVQIMAQLGITQDPAKGSDGTMGNLKIDSDKLKKALTDNPGGVQQYFIGDGKTTGLATQMSSTLDSMLSTSAGKTGVIQNAKDGINKTLKSLSERYDDMEASIDATMARYKTQFTQLDVLMTKMTNTANYLTQQFTKSS